MARHRADEAVVGLGEIDFDAEGMLSPWGEIEPTGDEIAAAEALWNQPLPPQPAPAPLSELPPIPQADLSFLVELLALVNRELARMNRRPTDIYTVWALCCRGRHAVSPSVASAVYHAVAAQGLDRVAGDPRLAALAGIGGGVKINFPGQAK